MSNRALNDIDIPMARLQADKDSGMMNTQLSGPERPAMWDEAVREIRATNGRLPRRP